MNSLGLSALLLALVPVGGFAADDPPASASLSREVEHVLSMSVEGTLLVDTDGSVRDYALITQVPPNLAAALGKAIKAWRFEPVIVDGELVRAEARMRISLAATKDGENYQVRVENAVFRPATPSAAGKDPAVQTNAVEATRRRLNPPTYPRELQRAGITGRVLVAMHFSPEGKVLEVVPVQGMIFDTSGHDRAIAKAIKMFEDATIAAATRWSVNVKVKPGVPTTAKDFTAYTTVDYVLNSYPQGDTGEWRMVARTPKRPLPWLAGPEAPNVGVADVGAGETFALTEALRLKSPVGGSSL